MALDTARIARQSAVRLKRAGDAVIDRITVWLLKGLRRTNPDRLADFGAAVMRAVGPRLREHRIGRDNLRAAFPQKSSEEIERILTDVWDNLGRIAGEFVHLDRLWDYDPARPDAGRTFSTPAAFARLDGMRDDGKPALIFAPHLANWELPALAARSAGINFAAVFRRPNLAATAETIIEMRAGSMGAMIAGGLDAPFRIARALENGTHVGMLVDQHYERGFKVTFFGRPCGVNPTLARLARHYDCPIYGIRCIRHPGRRLEVDLVGPVEMPRDPDGRVNVEGTMQTITVPLWRVLPF